MAGHNEQLAFDFIDFLDASAYPAIPQSLPPAPKSLSPPEKAAFPDAFEYKPFGAWISLNRRLSPDDRKRRNLKALSILLQDPSSLTAEDLSALRSYSGWGGIDIKNEQGVLYDYYTSPPIADMTWRLLNKISPLYQGAHVLEPSSGTGVFFETAPPLLKLTGVELDPRTAAVASRLFPDITILNQSYELFNITKNDEKFDHIIGNVPFGERSPATAFLDMRDESSLDRYFLYRSLENLKPQGTMALIIHPGILANKTNQHFRLSIARKAQFMGAVKLNDHTFHHTHTAVQPDILFFQKHPEDIELRFSILSDEEFLAGGFADLFKPDSDYFASHPSHVMGTISRGTGQWGADEVKGGVTVEDIKNMLASFVPEKPFADRYSIARETYKLPRDDNHKTTLPLTPIEAEMVNSKKLPAGSVKVSLSDIYILNKNWSWNLTISDDLFLANRLSMIAGIAQEIKIIRDTMRRGASALDHQNKAKEYLETYKEIFKEYPEYDKTVLYFLNHHPSVSGIYDSFLSPDADILNVDNLYDRNGIIINGHNLAVSTLLKIQSSMMEGTEENILKLYPDTAQEIIEEFYKNKDVFITSDNVWKLREDFIEGDAWKKIDALESAEKIETNPLKKEKLSYGKQELLNAIGWIPIEDADVTPHSTWIPEYIINAWIYDNNGLNRPEISRGGVISKNQEGKWGIRTNIPSLEKYKSLQQWDKIDYKNGIWDEQNFDVIYYLNMQKQRSKYYDTDTYNKEHNHLFKNYIANHTEYREKIETTFNHLFNTEIKRPVKTYPVYLEGWRSEIKQPRDHQWQSIHHLYRQGKGISALGTGFGKTLAAIGLDALLRQEGRVKRTWLQVPNNKVKDWTREIYQVLPRRKVEFIDPEMRGYSNRAVRYAKYQDIASKDFDIVIMPESAAGEIQLNQKNDDIISKDSVSKHMMDAGEDSTQRAVENFKIMTERKFENGKTNQTISFEDFGCDALIVDEAHRYKNLFSSSLSRETGLNDGRQSAKAMALFKKSEYIRRNNDGKNVFLLTATPLTNSPLEYYNMLMYISPEELEKFEIFTINGFIKNFADIEEGFACDWKNGAVSRKKILTGFKNIKTLQDIFFKYTDYQNDPELINLKKPSSSNHPNIIPSNQTQVEVIKEISSNLEKYINTKKELRTELFPRQNFLTFYSQMRTASLDLELFDPVNYLSWVNPKLEELSKNVRAIFEKTKAGQVIFCDRVISSDGSFNLHDKILNCLLKTGFKTGQITIINGFTKQGAQKTDSAVEKEVSKAVEFFNEGKFKVLIGSTSCIGEGLNLQDNSAAIHHFDIPFRPSDFIQRNGRIDRQGNLQQNVELHSYMSGGTIDNYSVSLVQRKAAWIDKLLKTKSHVFVNPNDENFIDADELLLALTEEWGDKNKAALRRSEIERMKKSKILEAQNDQRKNNLASLSMLRGALSSFNGNSSSIQYKNRILKIKNIESSLNNNQTFVFHDIIKNNIPFLYAKNIDQIILRGDVFYVYGKPFEIINLDFKKQELSAKFIDDYKGIDYTIKPNETHTKMEIINVNTIYKKYEFRYFSQLDTGNINFCKLLHKRDFYDIPDRSFKEKFYLNHLLCYHRSDNILPVYFFLKTNDSKICIMNSAIDYYKITNNITLNPFNNKDAAVIKISLKQNTVLDDNNILLDKRESLLKQFPHLFAPNHSEMMLNTIGNTTGNTTGIRTPNPNKIAALHSIADLKKNVVRLHKLPQYSGNPLAAVKYLLGAASAESRAAIKNEFITSGCTSQKKIEEFINSWVSPPRIEQREPMIRER
jgi:hypothetical protein